jgi:hypothetical protein
LLDWHAAYVVAYIAGGAGVNRLTVAADLKVR